MILIERRREIGHSATFDTDNPFGLLIQLTGPGWGLGFFLVGTIGMVADVVAGNVISGGFMRAYCPTS